MALTGLWSCALGTQLFTPSYLKIPATWLSPVKSSYMFSTPVRACSPRDVSVSGRLCSRQARVDARGRGGGQEGVAVMGTGILTFKVSSFLEGGCLSSRTLPPSA